jgi:hypothetical protein
MAAAQFVAAPDFEPRVATSQVRYHFACGSKPVSFERWAATISHGSDRPSFVPRNVSSGKFCSHCQAESILENKSAAACRKRGVHGEKRVVINRG